MNHQQILEKLSARHIVEAIADDVSRLTAWEMTGSKGAGRGQGEASSRVVSSALLRWNCVLQAPPDALPALYRQKTALALALVLHKHGFQDRSITDEALKAVDALNDAVALSDDFFRKSDAVKAFISAPPVPLSRRPSVKNATFWRAGDVASIRVAGRYFAAYVHEIAGAGEAPVVEAYDLVSDRPIRGDDVRAAQAKGLADNVGVRRAERLCVYGMKFVEDPANQFHLIVGGVPSGPDAAGLGAPIGKYAVSDLFRFLRSLQSLFG